MKKFVENLSLGNSQRGSVTVIVAVIATVAGILAGLEIISQNLEQSKEVSDKSRATVADYLAIDAAMNSFSTLLDAQVLYICGHNVPFDYPSNNSSTGAKEPSPYCTSAKAGKINITYPMTSGSNWSWDEATQTFTHRSCYGKELSDTALAGIYSASASTTAFTGCSELTSTLKITESNMTSLYLVVEGDASAMVNGQPQAVKAKLRVGFPNACNPNPATPSPTDFFTGYSGSAQKKVRKITSAADWRKIKPGGKYELELANPATPLELTKAELDWTQRPLKNVFFRGGKASGAKIKIMDDTAQVAKDNVGLFGDMSCSVVSDVKVQIGESGASGKGARPGRGCVGGIAGIIRGSLVANSEIKDPLLDPADSDRHIKGITGVGGVVGCVDNPDFWASRITSVTADTVVQTMPNTGGEQVIAGGIVGINKGIVDDVTSQGQLIAYLENDAFASFGGIAGASMTAQGEMLDVHNNVMNITQAPLSRDIGNVGGLVGLLESGPPDRPALARSTSAGTIDVAGANIGGLVGLMGEPPTPIVSTSTPTITTATAVKIAESINRGRVVGGTNVGGLVGKAEGMSLAAKHEIYGSYQEPSAGEPGVPSIDTRTHAPAGRVGGLVGSAENLTVHASFNLASVETAGTLSGFSDSLIGESLGGTTLTASVFYDNTKSPLTSTTTAVGLTTAQITAHAAPVSTYTGVVTDSVGAPSPNNSTWALPASSAPGLPATVDDPPVDKCCVSDAYIQP